MRIITIAGKVDSRVIVYSLARALSINGLTAIVSDDGAYRRLYKGEKLQGNATGVDIFVSLRLDETVFNLVEDTGVNYDNIIVVSTNFIPRRTTHLILCHGVDNSVSRYIENVPSTTEKKKISLFGKKTEEVDNREPISDIEVVNNVDDNFKFSADIPVSEIYISFNKPVQKYSDGLILNAKCIEYVYGCEESKELRKLEDKNLNEKIVSLISPVLGMKSQDLLMQFNRDIYLTKDS